MKRASAVASALLATAAAAYVLPAYSILRRAAEKRDELQLLSLRADGSITFFGNAAKEAAAALSLGSERPELQLDASVMLRLPRRCRVELTSTESGRTYARSINNGKRKGESAEISALSTALTEVCAFLAERSGSEMEGRAALERHLKALGVHSDVTSLGRFGGQVALVLGDPGDGKPQAWFYKDSFQPARIRFADGSGTAWDVRLLDFGAPATGEWFPRTLEVYQGTDLQLRFTALKADGHTPLPDRLF